jgi:8-oxo-dGTP diphosphatase
MTSVIQVDPEKPRQAEQAMWDVAVGVLYQQDGRFLMTSRVAGQPYAGYWEFPGGKLEPGETAEQALVRELQEELEVTPTKWDFLGLLNLDYPHAKVRLHVFRVNAWQGVLSPCLGQQMSWQVQAQAQALSVDVEPVLPGSWPVLSLLKEALQNASVLLR